MKDGKKKEDKNKISDLFDQLTGEIPDLHQDKTLTHLYPDTVSVDPIGGVAIDPLTLAGTTLEKPNDSSVPFGVAANAMSKVAGITFPIGGAAIDPFTIEGLSGYAAFEINRQSDQVFEKNQALEKEMSELKKKLKAKEKNEVEKDRLVKELIQKERLKHLFSRLHEDACEKLLKEPEYADQFKSGRSCNSVVISIDIRDSTQLMLTARTPDDYARFITKLCLDLSNLIRSNFGVFDKFTGDGVLAFFPDFYSGPHSIFYALKTATMAHQLFAHHYEEHRYCFNCVRADVGLGIGIDYGSTNLATILGDLSVVGTPVVYSCRLSIAPAGCTYSNQNAYEKIKESYSPNFSFSEVKVPFKNQGTMIAYSIDLNFNIINVTNPDWLKKKL